MTATRVRWKCARPIGKGTSVPEQAAKGRNAPASPGKEPRTARGRETLRRLLDAAAAEFGGRGFHEASVSGITRRAGTALGSFYTYFESKDAIFSALVRDMSQSVARAAAREAPSTSSMRISKICRW